LGMDLCEGSIKSLNRSHWNYKNSHWCKNLDFKKKLTFFAIDQVVFAPRTQTYMRQKKMVYLISVFVFYISRPKARHQATKCRDFTSVIQIQLKL
jgi:hypothetical protein